MGKKSTNTDKLRNDLLKVRSDWTQVMKEEKTVSDQIFLKEMADDLKQLDTDAAEAKDSKEAELIHYLLTTPWGAPFIGDTTLLEAAQKYDPNTSANTDFYKLLESFSKYAKTCDTQLFKIFDDISESLDEKQ